MAELDDIDRLGMEGALKVMMGQCHRLCTGYIAIVMAAAQPNPPQSFPLSTPLRADGPLLPQVDEVAVTAIDKRLKALKAAAAAAADGGDVSKAVGGSRDEGGEVCAAAR